MPFTIRYVTTVTTALGKMYGANKIFSHMIHIYNSLCYTVGALFGGFNEFLNQVCVWLLEIVFSGKSVDVPAPRAINN